MTTSCMARAGGPLREPITAAVIAASSQTGGAAVRRLLSAHPHVTVRAGFRSADRAKPLVDMFGPSGNLLLVHGIDADDPSTLGRVFNGCSIAYIVTPADPKGFGQETQRNANMIQAALNSGVKHIVFGGSWTVTAADAVPKLAARFAPTEALLASLAAQGKCTYTNIRGGFYANNLKLMFGPSVKSSGSFRFPSNVSIPPVCTNDIGRSAAAVIADGGKGHEGKSYDMSGPALLDGAAFAASLSKCVGKPVKHIPVPVEEFTARMPPWSAELYKYLSSTTLPVSEDIEKLTGSHTSFDEWLSLNRAAFV